jgi:hypothetical protein
MDDELPSPTVYTPNRWINLAPLAAETLPDRDDVRFRRVRPRPTEQRLAEVIDRQFEEDGVLHIGFAVPYEPASRSRACLAAIEETMADIAGVVQENYHGNSLDLPGQRQQHIRYFKIADPELASHFIALMQDAGVDVKTETLRPRRMEEGPGVWLPWSLEELLERMNKLAVHMAPPQKSSVRSR